MSDGALNSAVSGLIAESRAMSVIADNLANSSTVGYKENEANFQSMVVTNAAGNYYQSGGVATGIRQNVTVQGTVTSASGATDMAIAGDGLFAVTQGTTTGGEIFYTRNGQFSTDANGILCDGNYYLQGWPTDSAGNPTASTNGTTGLTTIDTNKYSSSAQASSTASMTANLPANATAGQTFASTMEIYDSLGTQQSVPMAWTDLGNNQWSCTLGVPTSPSDTTTVTAGPGSNAAALGIPAGTFTVATATTAGTAVPIAITPGMSTNQIIAAINAQTANTDVTATLVGSSISLSTADGTAITATNTSGSATLISDLGLSGVTAAASTTSVTGTTIPLSGTATVTINGSAPTSTFYAMFNSSGDLVQAATTQAALAAPTGTSASGVAATNSGNPVNVYIGVAGWKDGAVTGTAASTLNPNANTVQWTLGTSGGANGLTQYDQSTGTLAFNVGTQNVDGVAYGSLDGVSVGVDGTVTANYTNGQSLKIYKIALATFSNEDGLNLNAGGVYSQTAASGSPTMHIAGEGGTGTIDSGALENSTVDTSTEFSKMIVAQQAYSAATQVISTTKTMFQALIGAVQ